VSKRVRSRPYELIPLQTLRYRTWTTLRWHKLHRRLLLTNGCIRKLWKQ